MRRATSRRPARGGVGSGLALDVRLSFRSLLASPLVTVPAVLTLALAIGANTAVFSIVNTLLLRPLPVAAPDRLFSVSSDFAADRGFKAGAGWSHSMWEAFRQRSAFFGGVLAWQPQRFTIGTPGETESVSGFYASGEFFATLGVRPLRGRLFTSADDSPSSTGVVAVISHRLWLRRFKGTDQHGPTGANADGESIGSPLVVDGIPVTVIGVTPPSFLGLEVGQPFDVALPIGAQPIIRGQDAALLNPRAFLLLVMLRLKDGQSVAEATATLRGLQREIVPAKAPSFVSEPFTLVPAAGGAEGPTSAQQLYRRPLLVMLACVALVLVIACINIANLLVARATARQRELSVRAALGASRWRLARPVLIESVWLGLSGTAIGLLFAFWGARGILALTPIVLDPALDARVAAFIAAITAAAVLLSGLAPILGAARSRSIASLKVGPGTDGGASRRLSGALVVVQVGLALALLVAAGLLVRTYSGLAAVPLGFDRDRVLVVRLEPARSSSGRARDPLLYDRLARVIEALPGVERAAASRWTPLRGAGLVRGVRLPGGSVSEVNVLMNFVGPGWFDVYGTRLESGRDFTEYDSPTSPRVVVVNRAFVRAFMPGENPLGRMTAAGELIVGIAGDAVYRSSQRIPGVPSLALREPVAPTMYVPLTQVPLRDAPPSDVMHISVRFAGGKLAALGGSIGAAIASIDPDLTFELRPLSADVSASLAQERLSAAVSGCFGLLAALLAVIGVYGVTSYGVSRRATEIGLRMALGATRSGIVRLILRGALIRIGMGIMLGGAGAVILARWLAGLLFGMAPVDPLTFAAVALMLSFIGTAAAVIPARKASRADPSAVLRGQ
jgi:predicted permease